MATGDTNFYLSKYINNDNYLLYVDFASANTYYYNLVSGYEDLISGSDGLDQHEFYDRYSAFYFNSGFSNSDFTVILDSEKQDTGSQTILSTYNNSNSIRSGFSIGTNELNQPYFRYYNNSGPQILTFNRSVPERSIIAVTKAGNSLTMAWFNPNTLKFEEEVFNMFGIYEIRNNTSPWLVGKESLLQTPELPHINNFNGEIHSLVYVDDTVASETLNLAIQGFYRTGAGYIEQVEIITSNEITGYETGIQLIPIDHPETTLIGTLVDSCGKEFPVYRNGVVTGYGSGDYLIPLYGDVTTYITGYAEVSGSLVESYLQEYRYDSIGITRHRTSGDQVFGYYSDIDRGDYFNKRAYYDHVEGEWKYNYEISFDHPSGDKVLAEQVYLNGQYVFRDGIESIGDLFNPAYQLDWDYVNSGSMIFSNSVYDPESVVVFDVNNVWLVVSGVYSSEAGGGYSTSVVGGNPFLGHSFYGYMNGLAMIQYEDFNGNYGMGTINASGSDDFIVYLADDVTYLSGKGTNVGKYYPATSRIWLNGQRQTLELDYLEISQNVNVLMGGYASDAPTGNIMSSSDFLLFQE